MAGWGPFDLTGMNAVVTGGASGIGFGIVTWFLEAGSNVLIADVNEPGAEAAIQTLARGDGRVAAMGADVSKDGAGETIVARCVEQFGSVDIFVNNAAIYPMASMLDTTPELFDRVLNTNLKGLAFCSKAAAVQMITQGRGGKIINIAALNAIRCSARGIVPYDISKAGVVRFTKSLALELASFGIHVNAIAPGQIRTDHIAAPAELERRERLRAEVERIIPLGRSGLPDDIAKAAVFLASPASDYITGELVVVDGGLQLV